MKEKKNLLVLLLIVFIITTIGLGGFVIYDKLIKEDNKTTSNKTCAKDGVSGEQMIFAEMGTIYISANGDVYYDPNENTDLFGEKINMRNYAQDLFGSPKSYFVESSKFMEGNHTFQYKLDLSNVRSVSEFYFGNGGVNITLLFIHNNGNVSELSFNYDNMKLYKNVSGYSNIVSMVADSSEDGHDAKLYDTCGNGIDYTSPRYNNNY